MGTGTYLSSGVSCQLDQLLADVRKFCVAREFRKSGDLCSAEQARQAQYWNSPGGIRAQAARAGLLSPAEDDRVSVALGEIESLNGEGRRAVTSLVNCLFRLRKRASLEAAAHARFNGGSTNGSMPTEPLSTPGTRSRERSPYFVST